jgi:cytochrome oxidase assembly protein ShyY1
MSHLEHQPNMSPDKTKRKFPVLATLVALGAIVIMLTLGFWQLDRKLEKEGRLERIAFAQQQASIGISDVLDDYMEYQDYSVSANGELLDALFYIDNKLKEGKAGFNAMQPFKTANGVVLLDLGWLAATAPRPALPAFERFGFKHVEGMLYVPENNKLITETNTNYGSFPALLQQIDLKQIEQHLGQSVLPFILRLQDNTSSTFVRDWEAVTMSPEKHLGYAIQWFGLAVAGLTIYLLSLLKWMQVSKSGETQ